MENYNNQTPPPPPARTDTIFTPGPSGRSRGIPRRFSRAFTTCFAFVATMVVMGFLSSCQDDAVLSDYADFNDEETIIISSPMTGEDFFNNCLAIQSQLGQSRVSQISEIEAKKIVQPFINDGLEIRDQINKQLEMQPSMSEEVVKFDRMTEEECAILSFTLHAMKQAGLDSNIILEGSDKSQSLTVNTERLVHCLAIAVGYDFLRKLSVKGVVSALTVRQAILAIGKRYLGYVGVVLIIADFVGCVG